MPIDGSDAPRRRSAGVAVGSLLVLVGAVALTGCRTSPREDASYTDSGGTIRCASGQSVVGESGDRDGAGKLPAGAITQARMQLYCANEDPDLAPGWTRLEAKVELRRNGSTCASSPTAVTTTAPDVRASVNVWCGAGDYQAIGTHVGRGANAATYTRTSRTEVVGVS